MSGAEDKRELLGIADAYERLAKLPVKKIVEGEPVA